MPIRLFQQTGRQVLLWSAVLVCLPDLIYSLSSAFCFVLIPEPGEPPNLDGALGSRPGLAVCVYIVTPCGWPAALQLFQ